VDKNELAKMSGRAHHVDEIIRVALDLAKVVADIERAGNIAIVLGGDHSMAMGTLAGIAAGGRRPGVIWMDAHGDSNTPQTSPSGNVHGMPFAVAFGLAADPFPKDLRGSVDGHNGVLIALRSVDGREKDNIKAAGVTPITMADIDRMGMSAAMEKAIAIASKGDGIHLSLDMDAIAGDVRRRLPLVVPDRGVGAVLHQKVEARAVAGERDRVKGRGARLALRIRVRTLLEQHAHDLGVARAGVRGHRGMQRREAALARGWSRVGAGVEQLTHNVASLEERSQPERRVAVRCDGVRLRGIP